MSNANEPAYPSPYTVCSGLTKREYFAAMVMQGMYAAESADFGFGSVERTAEHAVEAADALLSALAKEPTK